VVVGLSDGRLLEALVAGPEGGVPLVCHHGTPFAAAPRPVALAVARDHGLRTIIANRPGYAGSTARPARTVADVASDTAALLDQLGHGRFLTLGWSGGGPHALACAALLGDRCMAAATVGGVAPADAGGLAWLDGMGPENVEEFTLARSGGLAFSSFLERSAATMADVSGAQLAASLGGLVSDVDRDTLTHELADSLAASLRSALSRGVEGWREDDLAFLAPWGFDPGAVRGPVAVWQGGQDLMVPPSHGAWLADHVPAARRWLLPAEGHLSLVVDFDRVVRDLLDLAGPER
jgi:pimeloyl-ACP methyl ester carboxylesterase